MNSYTLRIDALEGVTRDRVSSFCRNGGYDEFMVVHEIATETGKPHFQGFVKTDVKHQTYQKRVIAAFPECVAKKGQRGGRGHYSAAVCRDIDSYSRYIMKGTPTDVPDVVCSSKQLDLRECWAEARAAEADKAKKNRDSCDNSKSVLHRGIDHFKGVAQSWPFDMDQSAKFREVGRWLLNDYVERNKAPNDFLIRNYITGILNATDSQSFEYNLDRIVSKLL